MDFVIQQRLGPVPKRSVAIHQSEGTPFLGEIN